jgi:hypothetical protein
VTETAQWQSQYQATLNADATVTITVPNTDGWVDAGAVTITATPSGGYTFASWTTTGAITLTSTTSPTTTATVTGPFSLTANTNTATFALTATAGANGEITPSGTLAFNHGTSRTFTITPASGYHVADVKVDGTSVGAVNSYTFSNIVSSHTITASFAVNTYMIDVNSSHGNPTASAQVNYGESFTVQVTSPELIDDTHQWECTGYSVDGGANFNTTSYTFTNIDADHTIVFNWQAVIIITPTIETRAENGTQVSTGTPFTFETTGNITVTQISNPTMYVNETANTVTLSMNLTGPSGTTGFCNMTIPKSSMPAGVIPTPIVYIDGVLAEQQGYCEDAINFYVWYSTHFSNHIGDVIFPSAPTQPTITSTPTPTQTAIPTTTATTTPTQTVTHTASPSTSQSTQPTQQPEQPTDLTPVIAGSIAIAVVALVLIALVAKRRKKKTETEA